MTKLLIVLCALSLNLTVEAQEHHQHQANVDGMVMNHNVDTLPLDCDSISEDVIIDVRAGTQYAEVNGSKIYGYSDYEYFALPCARVNVTLHNDDDVRHQWMLHGLPRYLYPEGMFHLEANAKSSVSGSFIVPSDDATYLVHCDVTGHMEKGMKAQLLVGKGAGTLWSIPTISADFNHNDRIPAALGSLVIGSLAFALGLALSLRYASRNIANKKRLS
ncbi:MAG: hypothetical protein R3332_07375 [Pseudohongiellaceae bacterium]|nr:hypothetical protein [Pseudohongiellaceae bacterium]